METAESFSLIRWLPNHHQKFRVVALICLLQPRMSPASIGLVLFYMARCSLSVTSKSNIGVVLWCWEVPESNQSNYSSFSTCHLLRPFSPWFFPSAYFISCFPIVNVFLDWPLGVSYIVHVQLFCAHDNLTFASIGLTAFLTTFYKCFHLTFMHRFVRSKLSNMFEYQILILGNTIPTLHKTSMAY